MIGRMTLTMTLTVAMLAFTGGIAHSSFRHYYKRYASDEDLRSLGDVQEVVVVGNESMNLEAEA